MILKTILTTSITALAVMIPVSQANAAPADGCVLPSSIAGKHILMEDTQAKSESNPYGGESYVMSYNTNTYSYVTIDGQSFKGEYTYKVNPDKTATIESKETDNGTKVAYTMTLTCKTSIAGSYIYKQQAGIGQPVRSNTANYAFLN